MWGSCEETDRYQWGKCPACEREVPLKPIKVDGQTVMWQGQCYCRLAEHDEINVLRLMVEPLQHIRLTFTPQDPPS